MRAIPLLVLTALVGCEGNNECVTDFGCGEQGVCVSNACVGVEVEGDHRALYDREFRLRLERDCVVCHADGLREAHVEPGDAFWRFYSGVTLDEARVDENFADLLDFLGRGDPVDSPLVTYGRGLAGHPVIYDDVTDIGYRRVINWLRLFPEPEAPPIDPDVPEPGEPGYVAIVHGTLVQGCRCHVDPARAWAIAAQDAVEADLQASYSATREWFTPGDAAGSRLIKYGQGELGHPGSFWTAGDANYEQVTDWIMRTSE